MIQEEFVKFETAKLLYRNGFAVKCGSYYLPDGTRFGHCHQEVLPKGEKAYECPTQAVAMRWIREEYSIEVSPIPYRYPGKWKIIIVYLGPSMEKDDKYDICMLDEVYASFEEAAESGIQYAVKHVVSSIRKELKAAVRKELKRVK